jgi:hypothetical protein
MTCMRVEQDEAKVRAKTRFPSNFRGGSFPIFDQWAIIHQNLDPH